MPFDLTAVSGINAASEGLGVVSNNLANAQTTAFKASRAEFADVFYGAQNSPGNGARVGSITQDFSNGTISSTGRDLDMAIDGEGFFILEDRTGKYGNVYTRNGSFKVDKDGFVASQDGNALQGYLLDTALSTEAIPVFDTTLSSINLDELNKVPKATDSMTFNINLDGQEPNNIDPAQTPSANKINNSAGGNTALGGSTLPNIQKLTNPEADPFGGSPDFSTGKLVYDTLGGEHRLTTNFYKRDVVTVVNSDLTYDPVTQTYAQGAAGSGNAKYTSWIAQMTVEDYDLATGQWQTSGHKEAVPADGKASADAGMIFELRFDTNGSLIDVREPVIAALVAGANSTPVGQDTVNTPLDNASWSQVGAQPEMPWVIDNPITGAQDPLGNPADPKGIKITADFTALTQYAGTYNLRGVTQNGYQIGDLVGVTTGQDGIVEARYSNGLAVKVAQLGVANFSDKNAMEKLGGQTYAESFASGAVQIGTPQENGFGSINSGALEYSNVNTASELVNMIQMQRTYQASAQVVQTAKTLTQAILQI